MTEKINSQPVLHFFIITALLVVIMWGTYHAQTLLSLFFLSLFISIIATPLIRFLQRRHIPFGVGVLLVIVILIILFGLISILVGTSIKNLSENIPTYMQRLDEQSAELRKMLADKNIIINEKKFTDSFKPDALMTVAGSVVIAIGSLFSNVVLVFLMVTFLLLESPYFSAKLREGLGTTKPFFLNFTAFIKNLNRYIIVQTILSFAAGVLVTLWLYVLGIEYALLLGVLVFLSTYIPSIGPLFVIIPIFLLSYIQFGIGYGFLGGGGAAAITFALGNFVYPKLMGERLGLSTLVVFLSVIFWGSLLGVVGTILCVPLTMALKFALENSNSTRWIAILLGPSLSEDNKKITKEK